MTCHREGFKGSRQGEDACTANRRPDGSEARYHVDGRAGASVRANAGRGGGVGCRRLGVLLAAVVCIVALDGLKVDAQRRVEGLRDERRGSLGRGRYQSVGQGGGKHRIPLLGGADVDEDGDAQRDLERPGQGTGGGGWREQSWDMYGDKKSVFEGVVADVWSMVRPLAKAFFGEELLQPADETFHVSVRSHDGPIHAFYLAPFWVSSKGLLEAAKAGTVDWLGYGRASGPDPNIKEASAISYQNMIKEITQWPQEKPIGGVILQEAADGSPAKYAWNGPTTGGVTVHVIGMGFGWDNRECSANCLAGGTCVPEYCLYVQAQVGNTKASAVQWYSDSSITLKVPPGTGTGVSVNITSGRFKENRDLASWFTYDAPEESRVIPNNGPTFGLSAMTIFGKNFGSVAGLTRGVAVGETSCKSVFWMSDSQIACMTLERGTGAFHNVRVNIGGEFSEGDQLGGRINPSPGGITKAFSYNRPTISAISPNNGPTKGYVTAMTIYGKNFGAGPPSMPNECKEESGLEYVLKPMDRRYCGPGFVQAKGKSFQIAQFDGDKTYNLYWDNIRPTSLAWDPIACVYAAYQCDWLQILDACRYVPESCKPISDKSVPVVPYHQLPVVKTTCPVLNAALDPSPCAPHMVGSYVKDGVTCDYTDPFENQTKSYFKNRGLSANELMCKILPKAPFECTNCEGVGCCNVKGSFGGLVAGTECATLMWLSDSSLVCKVAPGIGSGFDVMVAIDDEKGSQLGIGKYMWSFDSPMVTSILGTTDQNAVGGGAVTLFGSSFGPFQCNRSWCTFDRLELCDTVAGKSQPDCSLVGDLPKRQSKVISNAASILSTYQDGRPIGRTACAETIWQSDSSMTCKLAAGTGDMRTVEITVFKQGNRYTDSMRQYPRSAAVAYKTPEPSSVTGFPDGQYSSMHPIVTVRGKQFGAFDTSPKARLGGTACFHTMWVSDTIVLCRAPAGIQPPAKDCNSLSGDLGATEELCKLNLCSTCLDGLSQTSCTRPYDTNIEGTGQGFCNSIVVTVDMQRGMRTDAFSYSEAKITSLLPNNGPLNSKYNITVLGKNFGTTAAYQQRIDVGGTDCISLGWTSDSSISCSMPKGMGVGHAPRMKIEWNSKQAEWNFEQFSYDRPVVTGMVPSIIPTSGSVQVTLYGKNFGALDEFYDANRIVSPIPPKATIGDTACQITQWKSDAEVTCIVGGPTSLLSRGGPGVGTGLPVIAAVGGQLGTFEGTFGYATPRITATSERNSPADGNKLIMITGDSMGVYDYSPHAKIGDTECKSTQWFSDSALRCVTPAATTFLAGQNIELPVEVSVGLSHRVGSTQKGIISSYFNFDFPKPAVFSLNNLEINLLCFSGAIFLAALIICILHSRYQHHWKASEITLPVRYARTQTSNQESLRPKYLVPPPMVGLPETPSDSETSSESPSSEEEDEETREHERNRLLKAAGPADVEIDIDNSDSDSNEEARERKARILQLGLGDDKAGADFRKSKGKTGVGKDTATGKPIVFTDYKTPGAKPYGQMSYALPSVPTPIPSKHKDHTGKKDRKQKSGKEDLGLLEMPLVMPPRQLPHRHKGEDGDDEDEDEDIRF